MIARIWRGATRAEDAEAYAAYVEESAMRPARDLPGNRGTLVLRRVVGDRAEFVTVLLFETEADVRGFAGDEPGRAVFFPEDDRFLVERDPDVRHYEADVRLD